MDAENQGTLIERRKRLHELASEINQWEDESFKCHGTPLTPTLSVSYEGLNRTTPSNYCSPKQPHCHTTITKSSPSRQLSPFNYNPLGINTNYLNRNLATSASHLAQQDSPSGATKRKLDTDKCVTFQQVGCSPSKIAAVNRSSIPSAREDIAKVKASSLVSSIKAQLEGGKPEVQQMTPKSIIQKFEALTKVEQAPVAPVAVPVQQPVPSWQQTGAPVSAPFQLKKRSTGEQAVVKEEKKPDADQSVIINTESIKPKSVIQKFEKLVKENGNALPMPVPIVPTTTTTTTIQTFEMRIRKSNETETNRDSGQNYGPATSLTYVSSIVNSTTTDRASSSSSQNLNDYELENETNNYYDEEEGEETVEMGEQAEEEEAIYEELGTPRAGLEDETSLFEDKTGYESMSGDESYTTDSTQTGTESNYSCVESICSSASAVVQPNEATKAKPPSGALITDEPLFSIKEYRKQKKGYYSNGGRRSSVSKMQNAASNPATTSKTKIVAKPLSSTEAADEQQKKNKEKIKELEDLIKQEDNIIYQTGIALEKCLNQSQFTGTGEHIECNRLLLISCQKRQAYQTEINRLRQVIAEASQKKAAAKPTESSSTTESSDTDLTGTLVLGEIQLPIKESYLKKLRTGEEKRIFYFICLVRNGIQVLQTQVISVQELLNSSHDSSITFPNRMAIKNVDVNFKVKIDVYTLEMLPKESKSSKQLGSNATHKFFSPFKNTVMNTLLNSGHHSHGASSSSSSRGTSNSGNHHYNDSSSLGVANGGSKTTNFIHVDTVEISNKELNQNKFKLSISSSSIPLSGLLIVNVRCTPSKSIELKGFLTIFEDINGLGSWDRRWCLLNNYSISYWKYPEDEAQSTPLGLINLSECHNEKVSILPREICARKYTIELVMNEDESSSSVCKRYRLSADTKEQANEWSTHINWALANLRLWNPKNKN